MMSDNEKTNRKIDAICNQARKDLKTIADSVADRESDHTVKSSVSTRNALLHIKDQMSRAIEELAELVVDVCVEEKEIGTFSDGELEGVQQLADLHVESMKGKKKCS